MLALLLTALTAVDQFLVVVRGASDGLTLDPSSFAPAYDPATWKEMADEFERLSVTERTNFINDNQKLWKASDELREELTKVKLMDSSAASYDRSTYPSKNASEFDENIPVPRHFDARDAWPQCHHLIEFVDNRRTCASSWAHATTSVMSDRLCIASSGTTQVSISAHHLVTCCPDCIPETSWTSCTGGYPVAAYKYWATDGLVTQSCVPLWGSDSSCTKACHYSYLFSFEKQRYHGENYYFLRSDGNATANAELIQREIMTNGPVTATINATSDFTSYDEGIFMPLSAVVTGYHTIKIIGWGEDKGLPYWLLVNSWGRTWGEDGYARVARSVNAMNIEGAVTAGSPKACDDGWSPMPGLEHNGRCYKVLSESMSWEEANTQCRRAGGKLASVANSDENAKLTGFLKTEGGGETAFFIGLHGVRIRGPYQWTDGTEFHYANWSPDVRAYGSLNVQDGMWSVGDFRTRLPALCQKQRITAF